MPYRAFTQQGLTVALSSSNDLQVVGLDSWVRPLDVGCDRSLMQCGVTACPIRAMHNPTKK